MSPRTAVASVSASRESRWLGTVAGRLKTRDWKTQDWKTLDQVAGVEKTGLKSTGLWQGEPGGTNNQVRKFFSFLKNFVIKKHRPEANIHPQIQKDWLD